MVIEVTVFISLFVIAAIASYFQNKKRALRKMEIIEQSQQKQTKKTIKPTARVNPPTLPEDSTLRRHYLGHLRAMIEASHAPRPSDSTLARHYESMIANELEQCLADETRILKYIHDDQPEKKTPAPQPVVKPITQAAVSRTIQKIPEDSTLRRHFITHLRSIIEATKQPRPTDCTLLRHYNATIDAELESQLEEEISQNIQ